MIIRCEKNEEERILSYISTDYPSCLYLYLDLKKYRIGSNTIDVYFQMEDKEITAVMLIYYSCLHVYARNISFNAKEIALFFQEKDLTMIYCTAQISDRLVSELPKSLSSKTEITKGWVAQIKQIDKYPKKIAVMANRKDFEQIVKLIFDDEEIGKSYRYDDLAEQLAERVQEGYARNLVIRQNNVVIAHACTNAEMENIAVVAELLVKKEFRRQGYASEIWRDICSQLLSENKEVYSIYYSEDSRQLHKHIGFYEVCRWAKIVVRRDN